MSTKRTLWHNDDLHLYAEGFDNENVYLEIRTAYTEQFVIRIPLTAWKEMRRYTIEPAERYLDMSDDELTVEAQRQVQEHRARLGEFKSAAMRSLAGFLVFGAPDSTPDEMVTQFLRHYRPALADKAGEVPRD
jgi:hypothetical protein